MYTMVRKETMLKVLKNYHESKADWLNKEFKKELNNMNKTNNRITCPMCEEGKMKHINYKNTHVYVCEVCPFVGCEIVEEKDYKLMIEWLNKRRGERK